MLILALDLGTNTGWARGTTDTIPRSGTVRLRPRGGSAADCLVGLEGFLGDVNLRGLPDLVAYESPMALGALTKLARPQNEEAATLPWRLEGVLWLWCRKRNVRYESVSALTYRKHFIGKASAGRPDQNKDQKRLETKIAMLSRAQVLGYIDRAALTGRSDATDPLYDRADGCGLWDYAAATWGRRQPKELHMFGEMV